MFLNGKHQPVLSFVPWSHTLDQLGYVVVGRPLSAQSLGLQLGDKFSEQLKTKHDNNKIHYPLTALSDKTS